jgi:hypothetical protein
MGAPELLAAAASSSVVSSFPLRMSLRRPGGMSNSAPTRARVLSPAPTRTSSCGRGVTQQE